MYHFTLFGCIFSALIISLPIFAQAQQSKPKTVKQIIALTNQYCGACHAPPSPQLLPKKSWPYIVKTMAEMAQENFGKPYISAEHIRDITAYYYGTSPTELPKLPYHETKERNRQFIPTKYISRSTLPMIAHINPVNLFKNNNTEFLISDDENNAVSLITMAQNKISEKVLAEIKMPSHTEVVDYDKDGKKDIIVASLGLFFTPQGKNQGKVTLLKQLESGDFDKQVLLENVGRVTDVKALDIDGDNDLDIAIAIFGADVPGELAWLENKGDDKHIKHTLMKATGALNLSPIDLNNDGLIDFVSLITQQHELIAGFINKGDGTFTTTKLFQANHPLMGFTSLKTVDLDGDNDLDLLMTNGDANDLQTDPKPYHGVQWLENKGDLKFEFKDIARFYGAVSSAVGDLDKDGDLDIVVSSWNNYWDDPKRQSLVWFENDGKQNFSRHNVPGAPKSITGLALADVTGNSYLDIIAGSFRMDLVKEQYNPANNTTKNIIRKVQLERVVLLENSKIIEIQPGLSH
ncbi:VCBS repeat-containing protein [Paraglaciecola aquimarina]|uniref:VCBS repeat-containing protein n=1 Tax=Paraglaciecola algarum TaxID=3050085 RepID=A0ABS9DC36_9ALTE|nr:VCBS repeat-containing protein [Paraglaciecola sp. G1-23]MCF2950489.1 VCBS repeat-containing protein [Paraglaciecola sp. G1-23]